MIGKHLAQFEITSLIGKGGMGEVYRARDTKLGRDVALKVIPRELSGDPERKARLEREARTLASLQHTNIASIYGFETIEDTQILVMELVEGEDLAQRLQRGRLDLEDCLDIARQIATGLEVAHEQGIVHRDLKPANVKITPDGQVKILDFGLARAYHGDASSQDDPAMSPTITATMTAQGAILGTAAYMSPEQSRGKRVDRRADIWAFGCVLFEILTQSRAFAGETVSDTLASLLTHTPDWSTLPDRTPRRVRELLARCLTKDARQRLRDIGEARVVLEDTNALWEDPATPVPSGAASSKGMLRFAIVALAGLALFGAGYLLRSMLSGSAADGINPDVRVRRLTYSEGLEQEPTLSPDGNYVAYTTDEAGNLDITVLPLAGGNAKRVVDHPADDAHPAWSPDGTRLAFVSARDQSGSLTSVGGLGPLSRVIHGLGGDIFLIPALGGAATKLVDGGLYPTWSPDGSEIAFQSNRDGQWNIWKIPATGGEPRALTTDDEFDYQPAWSPDGQWIVFCSFPGLRAVPADGGDPVTLFEGRVVAPAWSPDSRWVYFSCDRASTTANMNLWRIPFRPGDGPILQPQRITVGEGGEMGVDVSADGTLLAYSELTDTPDIWSWDPATGAVEPVAILDGGEDFPSLAPDGRRLAFTSDRGGMERIWTLDLEDRSLSQLETTRGAISPRWSPDGSRLLYVEEDEASRHIVIRRLGDVRAQVLVEDAGTATRPEWSPDGTRIVTGFDGIMLLTLDGERRQLVSDEDSSFPTWSPDGQQIAYQRQLSSGARELWAVPATGGEPRRIAGGDVEYSHPQWSPSDPDRILVIVDHQDLAVIRVSTGEVESTTSLRSARVLVDYPCWSFDGRRAYFSLARATGDLYTIEGL